MKTHTFRVPITEWTLDPAKRAAPSGYCEVRVYETAEQMRVVCRRIKKDIQVDAFPKEARDIVKSKYEALTNNSATFTKAGTLQRFSVIYFNNEYLSRDLIGCVAHEAAHAAMWFVRLKIGRWPRPKNFRENEQLAWAIGELTSGIYKHLTP